MLVLALVIAHGVAIDDCRCACPADEAAVVDVVADDEDADDDEAAEPGAEVVEVAEPTAWAPTAKPNPTTANPPPLIDERFVDPQTMFVASSACVGVGCATCAAISVASLASPLFGVAVVALPLVVAGGAAGASDVVVHQSDITSRTLITAGLGAAGFAGGAAAGAGLGYGLSVASAASDADTIESVVGFGIVGGVVTAAATTFVVVFTDPELRGQ